MLGLLPNPPMSPDNLRSLQVDSVTDGRTTFRLAAAAAGSGGADLSSPHRCKRRGRLPTNCVAAPALNG
jgi:hypothetical protein